MQLWPIVFALALGLSPLCGCKSQASSEPKNDSMLARLEHLVERDHDGDAEAEQRETEMEQRMRAEALESLDHFKAPTCDAALATIESTLRRGKGRWHERTETKTLPDDLLKLLTDAELYRNQAQAMCAGNARFNELSAIMSNIWKYPSHASRDELDQSLASLGS